MNNRSAPAPIGSLPGGRGVFGIVFVNSVAEYAAWIAVLVIAFDRGGASETGLAVVIQLVPAAILAPLIAAAGDRFPRDVVLTVALGTSALLAAGIATALALDAPVLLVYVLAAGVAIVLVATPSTVASLLVHYADSPGRLVRWNVSESAVRAAGSLVGPLLAGAVLAISGSTALFIGLALVLAGAAVATRSLFPHDDRVSTDVRLGDIMHDTADGVAYVVRTPGARRTVLYIGAVEVLCGSLDVFFVAVAFDVLSSGGGVTASLTAAFAAGTLLAAASAGRAVHRSLTVLTAVGAAALTVPLVALAALGHLTPVLLVIAVLGMGRALIEIGTHTLLQRASSEKLTSRVFGAVDSISLGAMAAGAAAAGAALDRWAIDATLTVTGVIAAIVLVAGTIALRRVERDARPVDPGLVVALRSVPFFASLPLPTLEQLATSAHSRHAPDGTELVVQGEVGEEFFVVVTGGVRIVVDGVVVDTDHAPAHFGEVALLHDTPRNATVVAIGDVEVITIGRDAFLDAIERTATSHAGARDVARRRVRGGHLPP